MNDNELDELLNAWKTPPPPAGMRERLRVASAPLSAEAAPARKVFRGWKVLVATAAALAMVVAITNKAALSQMLNPPPYTVDSEITVHPEDATGCIALGKIGLERLGCVPYTRPMHMLMSSYNADGSEVVLSWSDPGEPLESWLWSAKLAVLSGLDKVHEVLSPSEPGPDDHAAFYSASDQRWVIGEKTAFVRSGCRPGPRRGEMIGEEVLLGYPTIVSRFDYGKTRLTLSMAPRLSCFALRAAIERQQPDGSWTPVTEKKAVKVNVNR
jgi:hypothetical protein